MAENLGYNGQLDPGAGADDYAAVATAARQAMLSIKTTSLVQVKTVRNDGALALAGTVDVQILVNQVDGAGNPTPHGIIYNIPYIRAQGGTNAIILDPLVGDIGVCGFCSHDISAVKASKASANPASGRRFDYADGVYIGGVLNGIPEQFIRFSGDGIEVLSPTKIRLVAPVIEMEASETITMDAGDSIAAQAPDISNSGDTFSVDASSTASITAPLITLQGNTTNTGTLAVTGLASLNGGFGALPRAGGGTNVINSALNVTGAGTFNGTLTAANKNVGATHTHGGVQPGTGTSGSPT